MHSLWPCGAREGARGTATSKLLSSLFHPQAKSIRASWQSSNAVCDCSVRECVASQHAPSQHVLKDAIAHSGGYSKPRHSSSSPRERKSSIEDFPAKSARARLSHAASAQRPAFARSERGPSLQCSTANKNKPAETEIRKSEIRGKFCLHGNFRICTRSKRRNKNASGSYLFPNRKGCGKKIWRNLKNLSPKIFPERKPLKNSFYWKIQGPKISFKKEKPFPF